MGPRPSPNLRQDEPDDRDARRRRRRSGPATPAGAGRRARRRAHALHQVQGAAGPQQHPAARMHRPDHRRRQRPRTLLELQRAAHAYGDRERRRRAVDGLRQRQRAVRRRAEPRLQDQRHGHPHLRQTGPARRRGSAAGDARPPERGSLPRTSQGIAPVRRSQPRQAGRKRRRNLLRARAPAARERRRVGVGTTRRQRQARHHSAATGSPTRPAAEQPTGTTSPTGSDAHHDHARGPDPETTTTTAPQTSANAPKPGGNSNRASLRGPKHHRARPAPRAEHQTERRHP